MCNIYSTLRGLKDALVNISTAVVKAEIVF